MKYSHFALSISLVFFLTGCGSTAREETQTPSSEHSIPAPVSAINQLFDEISEDLDPSGVLQATAFFWNTSKNERLVQGHRLKIQQSSSTASDIDAFFTERNYRQVPENTENSDSSWRKGYLKEDLGCVIEGRNGRSESNTRDIVISCSTQIPS